MASQQIMLFLINSEHVYHKAGTVCSG